MSANLIAFVQACPGYLPAYELLSAVGRGPALKSVAEKLGTAPRGRTDREALSAYPWLWSMEFRATLASEHDSVRARVEKDLIGLREKYSPTDPIAVETFRAAYQITGDTKASAALPAAFEFVDPVFNAQQQWRRTHPWGETDPKELGEAARVWIAKWPDEPLPYLLRLRALSRLPQTREEDLVAAANELIAVNRNRPRRHLRVPAVIQVGDVYVNRGIRLDEVPALLADGIRQAETVTGIPESNFFDDWNRRLNEEVRSEAHIQARSVEFALAMKLGDRTRAHSALAAMREHLDRLTQITMRFPRFMDREYWSKMAQLADAEGRTDEAQRYRTRMQEQPMTASPGTAPQQSPSLSAVEKRLPMLRASAVDGRVLALDPKDKILVAILWATWCAPCVEKLPHVQKLYDRLKDKPNVVVVALNIDSNPGLVEPFLRGRGYTFPVLLAGDYVDEIGMGRLGIPRI